MKNTIIIDGVWKYHTLESKITYLKPFDKVVANSTITLDFKGLEKIDSSGIILIIRYLNMFKSKNIDINIINMTSTHQNMLELYQKNYVHQDEIRYDAKESYIDRLGKGTLDFFQNFIHFLYFVGRLFVHTLYLVAHPSKIRFKETIAQIDIAAIHILPIVALALFLVGFVTAYQGAEQLGRFGASVIVIEMSTMSMFREIAPFLAAVIVAGRSASSFTAQIGTMKITEEISAMRTMGMDPDIFLLLPRIFALVLVMPLLVFFADMAALLGEMVIVKMHLGVSYEQFISRIYEMVEIRHIMLGLLKAPLFGLLIGLIGCYRGLQVRNGSDIGRCTTKAVVDSIFWLIVINAIISLISIELGF